MIARGRTSMIASSLIRCDGWPNLRMKRFNITTLRPSTHGILCVLNSDVLRTHGRSSWIVTNTITHTEYVNGRPPGPDRHRQARVGSGFFQLDDERFTRRLVEVRLRRTHK